MSLTAPRPEALYSLLPVQVPGEAEAALHRLQAKLDAPSGARRPSGAVFAALEDVRTVTAHLRAWGLPGAQVTPPGCLTVHDSTALAQ